MNSIMRLAEPSRTIYLLRFSGIVRLVATSYNVCVYIGYDHRAISFKTLQKPSGDRMVQSLKPFRKIYQGSTHRIL